MCNFNKRWLNVISTFKPFRHTIARQAEMPTFLSQKPTLYLRSQLFRWRANFLIWKADFLYEKLTFNLKSKISSRKADFSAKKLTFYYYLKSRLFCVQSISYNSATGLSSSFVLTVKAARIPHHLQLRAQLMDTKTCSQFHCNQGRQRQIQKPNSALIQIWSTSKRQKKPTHMLTQSLWISQCRQIFHIRKFRLTKPGHNWQAFIPGNWIIPTFIMNNYSSNTVFVPILGLLVQIS